MPDYVRIGLQNNIFIDETRTRNRRAARMDCALNSVLPRPRHHLTRSLTVFHTPKANFTKNRHSGGGEFFEIILSHSVLDNGSTGMNSDAARSKGIERALRTDSHRLQPDDIF